MRPKAKTRKEPSERTRNLRHGATSNVAGEAATTEESAKSRVTKAVSDLALRTAAATGQQKAGIAKRQGKLTSKQQRRKHQQREKGIAFEAKVDVKADAYKRSQESIKQRASGWEVVNERAEEEKEETQAKFLALQEEVRLQREREALDGRVQEPVVTTTPASADDDEEEL
ncbi:hypothetical protein BCR37DRAFT_395358 [Protomyces lactucae-debilis]|uniref:Alb1-domain-containing protein n=1 Tax=Protomyces lactucae-debilis TaxID=2754530 RepID=A0A1Y2EX23_PROLT|nr:uncharacterized protein BCR37DRAFT_395358 [Protomyces lactucae-debilis]ORY76047.1 hypothetical protein BCR37DRAFT_395358 [Protomyces lactucae-debilis]